MNVYDPPSDPFYCAHECPECDQPLQKEIPQARDSEWICVNRACTRSPFFEPPKRAQCVDCGTSDFVDDDWELIGYDEAELWRCPKCQEQQVEA